MTTLLLLRGDSLEALKAQVVAEHGPAARIVKAESIVQGGIGGFLAKRFFEVTVEVPTPSPARAPLGASQNGARPATPPARRGMVLPNRSGIAALLADADAEEDRMKDPLTLSTSSARFDQLYDELSARVSSDSTAIAAIDSAASTVSTVSTATTAAATAAIVDSVVAAEQQFGRVLAPLPAVSPSRELALLPAPSPELAQSRSLFPIPSPFPQGTPVPVPESTQARTPPLPSRSAGDLVLLVGLRTDALRVAHSLSGRFGPASVCVGGTITLKSALRVSGRREAAQARADGVHNGCSVFVAYGIEPGSDLNTVIRDIGADQIWAVVDAGRKHEDTRLWVQNLASTVNVHAIAAFGLATTLTPESVQDLGVPVGWADGLLLGG